MNDTNIFNDQLGIEIKAVNAIKTEVILRN